MSSSGILGSMSDSGDIGWAAASHIWDAFRDLCEISSAVREEKYFRLNTGEPHPFANFVLLTDVDDAELARTSISPLVETPAPSAVILVSQQREGAATAVLEELGYGFAEHMPAMAVDIDELTDTVLPQGYEFKRITQDDREDWIETFIAGYGLPPQTGGAFIPATLSADPSDPVQYFAAIHEGKAVSVSMVYMSRGVAGIYCVATLSEHRGKGLGAHVTAEPLRIASGLGYGVGILQSSTMGHNVYKGLGFHDVGELPLYVRMP